VRVSRARDVSVARRRKGDGVKGVERERASEASSESNGNARRALTTRVERRRGTALDDDEDEDARSGVGCRFS